MGLSIPQLVIILAIAALIFGTKRLREVGGDLGSAVKSFRKAMNSTGEEVDDKESPKQLTQDEQEKK